MWPFFSSAKELLALGVTVFLWLVCATSSSPKNEFVSAEGVVVAIQGGKTDTRLVEPPSFADLAEIYMVRVDRWSQPRKEKYILVEYIHHADLIPVRRVRQDALELRDTPSITRRDQSLSQLDSPRGVISSHGFRCQGKASRPKIAHLFPDGEATFNRW